MVKLLIPSADSKWLESVSLAYQIPQEEAYALYSKCNFDKDKLLELLQVPPLNTASVNLPRVVVYHNGVLVGSLFYDLSTPDGRELVAMLDRNEFDRDIFEAAFGDKGSVADMVVERRDESYNSVLDMSDLKRNIEKNTEGDPPKRIKTDRQGPGETRLPETLTIGEDPRIKFMAILNNRECVVSVDKRLHIGDVMSYVWTNYGIRVCITMAGELLDEKEPVAVLRSTMVEFEST